MVIYSNVLEQKHFCGRHQKRQSLCSELNNQKRHRVRTQIYRTQDIKYSSDVNSFDTHDHLSTSIDTTVSTTLKVQTRLPSSTF